VKANKISRVTSFWLREIKCNNVSFQKTAVADTLHINVVVQLTWCGRFYSRCTCWL